MASKRCPMCKKRKVTTLVTPSKDMLIIEYVCRICKHKWREVKYV